MRRLRSVRLGNVMQSMYVQARNCEGQDRVKYNRMRKKIPADRCRDKLGDKRKSRQRQSDKKRRYIDEKQRYITDSMKEIERERGWKCM